MKKLYHICTIIVCSFLLYSCQNEDNIQGVGYLKLSVETNSSVNLQTKVAEDYNPKQIAIQIIDGDNQVVKEKDDWETWDESISLPIGTYTVKASSNGFDGSESGYEAAYYTGSEQVTIQEGKEVTAEIVCTLANVKVTVNFDDEFKTAFSTATVTVASLLENVSSLSFDMNGSQKTGYFPVGDLVPTISVTNKQGNTFGLTSATITDVKARNHYILNYKIAEKGSTSIKVTVNGEETVYSYDFNVSTKPATTLGIEEANAWSNFAYVKGSIESQKEGETLDVADMAFKYRIKDSDDSWLSEQAVSDGTSFKATLTDLEPKTSYEYKFVYKEEITSEIKTFTTESQETVPNSSFDDWCTAETNKLLGGTANTYYAATDVNNKYWDSGNEGSNKMSETNPTSPEEKDVVKQGKAARLSSTAVSRIFAAGNIYTGTFIEAKISLNNPGAILEFGKPFEGRPSQLKGWYKYNPGSIDYKNDKVSAVTKGDRDICSIYIALTDWTVPFTVNTQEGTFVNFDDESIIAYGELPADKTSPESMSEYEQFTIDIKYRDLTRKPTYILIVCSASKYGDYFTGSTKSVLLIDEFELVYGEPTIDTNYITEQ